MKFSALVLALAPMVAAEITAEYPYTAKSQTSCEKLMDAGVSPDSYFYGFKLVHGGSEGCQSTGGWVDLTDNTWFAEEAIGSCSTVDLDDIQVSVTCRDCDPSGAPCKVADVAFQSKTGKDISHLEIDVGNKGGSDPAGVLYDVHPSGATGLETCRGTDGCQDISHLNFCLECPEPDTDPDPCVPDTPCHVCNPDGSQSVIPGCGTGPGMGGDPHIKSWTGEWFDYHGECDLELVHVPKFDGFNDLDVHVRTTIQYEKYSYIEAAAVKIGKDVLEVGSWGEYALNGVEDAIKFTNQETSLLRKSQTVTSLGGYRVYHTMPSKKKNRFDIVISETENVTVSTFKEWVNVRLDSPDTSRYQKVEGILGNYKGQMVARDGVTDLSKNMNEFGQEWQVTNEQPMLFRTVRTPQYPQACILPTATESTKARRLGEGVGNEAAEAACAHLKKNEDAFAACIFDVQAMNDIDAASSGAY